MTKLLLGFFFLAKRSHTCTCDAVTRNFLSIVDNASSVPLFAVIYYHRRMVVHKWQQQTGIQNCKYMTRLLLVLKQALFLVAGFF